MWLTMLFVYCHITQSQSFNYNFFSSILKLNLIERTTWRSIFNVIIGMQNREWAEHVLFIHSNYVSSFHNSRSMETWATLWCFLNLCVFTQVSNAIALNNIVCLEEFYSHKKFSWLKHVRKTHSHFYIHDHRSLNQNNSRSKLFRIVFHQ